MFKSELKGEVHGRVSGKRKEGGSDVIILKYLEIRKLDTDDRILFYFFSIQGFNTDFMVPLPCND